MFHKFRIWRSEVTSLNPENDCDLGYHVSSTRYQIPCIKYHCHVQIEVDIFQEESRPQCSPQQPRPAQNTAENQEQPAAPESPSGSIWGASRFCYVCNTKKTPLTIFESQMWGGPLREAIWATRGSQEETRNRKDKTNAKKKQPNGRRVMPI